MSQQRMRRPIAALIVAIVAVVGLVGALPSLAQDDLQPTPVPMPIAPGSFPENTITVTGLGTAFGEPDVAYIELGVEMTNSDLAAEVGAVEEAEAEGVWVYLPVFWR